MGSLCLLHFTGRHTKCSSRTTMKFLLLAALVACAYAEPEADAYYSGYYGLGGYGYGLGAYSYAPRAYVSSYSYAPYRYGAYRLHKRDAEAEPKSDAEAKPEADAYYGGLYGYSGYGLGSYGYTSYAAAPYTSYTTAPYTSYGYAAPAYYGNYVHHGLYKRDAEAEPKSDAYYGGLYGY